VLSNGPTVLPAAGVVTLGHDYAAPTETAMPLPVPTPWHTYENGALIRDNVPSSTPLNVVSGAATRRCDHATPAYFPADGAHAANPMADQVYTDIIPPEHGLMGGASAPAGAAETDVDV